MRIPTDETRKFSRINTVYRYAVAVLSCFVVYVLSSGPIIATGCWLRDKTGWDRLYYVILPYFPLLDHDPVEAYIVWWLRLFGTSGPG